MERTQFCGLSFFFAAAAPWPGVCRCFNSKERRKHHATKRDHSGDGKTIDKGKRQIAKWDQKIMAQARLLKADANLAAAYSRKARTHRLCKRGAMLEKFLQSPDQLTDDQVMALLQIAFGQKQTQDALLAELDHAKTVQDTPEQKSDRRNYTPSR